MSVARLLELAGFAAAGAALGCVYVLALAAAAQRLVTGGARAAAWLTAFRLALLVAALTAASLLGTGPLLALALGLIVGRAVLVRRLGRVA